MKRLMGLLLMLLCGVGFVRCCMAMENGPAQQLSGGCPSGSRSDPELSLWTCLVDGLKRQICLTVAEHKIAHEIVSSILSREVEKVLPWLYEYGKKGHQEHVIVNSVFLPKLMFLEPFMQRGDKFKKGSCCRKGHTLLYLLILSNRRETLEFLFRYGEINLDSVPVGLHPLFVAIFAGLLSETGKMVELLLKYGADPRKPCGRGYKSSVMGKAQVYRDDNAIEAGAFSLLENRAKELDGAQATVEAAGARQAATKVTITTAQEN